MSKDIFFRSIYEHIEVPIFVINVDASGNFVFGNLNPACEKTTGLCMEDVIGKRPEDIPGFPKEAAVTLRVNCQRCIEANDAIHYEGPFFDHSQGSWWLTQLMPVRGDAGNIIFIIGSSVNITEQQRVIELLGKGEEKYRTLVEESFDGLFITSPGGRILDMNKKGIRMFGYDTKEEILNLDLEKDVYATPLDRKRILSMINEVGTAEYEVIVKKKNGEKMITYCSLTAVKDGNGTISSYRGVIRDITQRKRVENIMKARLRLLEFANSHSIDELLTATLDEMEALTDSSISFYHFLKADQKTLLLQNWSTNTLENMCTAVGKGSHYDVAQAGVWVDCVFERRPVIHNDYASLPHRKGMPEGHAPVVREVVVPILRGNQIKAIIGVGNKSTNYDKNDVEAISQLGDLSWDVVERMLAEDALKRSEEEKTILNHIANIFLTIPGEAVYKEFLAVVLQVMKSKFGIFGYIGEKGDLIIPSLTREIWDECQVPGKSIVFPPDSWRNSLWGRAIREKKAFYSEGPFHTPEGHIHIDHFLTVPIVYVQETIGLISVANKSGGYNEEDKDLLERITRNISPILHALLQKDIQEQKRMKAEGDLRESEEKYRLLVMNANEAIFIIQDEVVKFPNPKTLEITGCLTEELAEIPFIDLIHPEDKKAVFEGYLSLQEGERRPRVSPFRIIDKKGKEIWVQLVTAPIIWENKPGILCFFRDVTEEKKLEAQFMQAQKMEAVGRLAGGVAHDFNNMLGVIIGYTELTLMKIAPSDPLHEQLQKIDRAARRSADLTRQLLAFARRQTIVPEVLNLNDTLSGMLNMLRRLIGEDIDLAWRPAEGLWLVKMDPGQIDRILANLCVNARDAVDGVGKVTIETGNIVFDEAYCASHAGFSPGKYVLFAVSDDGCGMNKEIQAHLFEPFFTTKGLGKGTGLGLATVYGIVKQNHGLINVYSEPGKGTTFRIYLPQYMGDTEDTRMSAIPVKRIIRGQETILLVEDELGILDLTQKMLEELGYRVLSAGTPGEAIRIFEEQVDEIHLLITDVVMPEMNGSDLEKRMRTLYPNLKCLFMSGYTTNVIVHRGILDKGVHFIQKPFSIKELAIKVRETLDQDSTPGK